MKQPDYVKIPITKELTSLSNAALGFFAKMLMLGSRMTVKGVFVNGSVVSMEDTFERVKVPKGKWAGIVKELTDAGFIRFVGEDKVVMITGASVYYNGGASYALNELTCVVNVVRGAFGADIATQTAIAMQDIAQFKEAETTEQMRDRLRVLYAEFGEYRGRVISYVGRFRTKAQVASDKRMDAGRHLRLVEDLIEIYRTGLFKFRDSQYVVSREQFIAGIETVIKVGHLSSLSNHNYLKKVLMNQPIKREAESNGQSVVRNAENY